MWWAHGLKPLLLKTFKVSRDPKFVEKLEDIVGPCQQRHAHVEWVKFLNKIDRFFRSISIGRLARGVFRSVPELITPINAYIAVHNPDLPSW